MDSSPLTVPVFGKVDEYGGEFAATNFLHILRLPLIPTGSVWLSASELTFMARPIKWHWRSVMAAYLRTWVPLLWWFAFVADSVSGYLAAATALAVCGWTWTWRMAHRSNIQRQHDFDLVAIGTQCPPRLMTGAERQQRLTQQKAAFAGITTDRNPDDIARFGSHRSDELIAAYGLLRLHGATTPISASSAKFAAMRIMNGRHERPHDDNGIFRSTTDRSANPAMGLGQLADEVAIQANRIRAHTIVRAAQAPKSFVQKVIWGASVRPSSVWQPGGRHQLIGYAVLAFGCWIGAASLRNVRDPDTYDFVTPRALRNTIGDGKTEYRAQCDQWIEFIKANERRNEDTDVRMCQVGNKLLPVLSKHNEGIHGNTVRGRLVARHITTGHQHWEQRLVDDEQLDAQTFQVYMVTDVLSQAGQIVMDCTFALGSIGLGIVWIRVRRQRRRMIADAYFQSPRA
jgi:hypothetical protein